MSCPRSRAWMWTARPHTVQNSFPLSLPGPKGPTFNPPGEQLLQVRARPLLPRVSSPVCFHLAQGEQIQEKETCWLAKSNYPKLLPLGGGPTRMLCGWGGGQKPSQLSPPPQCSVGQSEWQFTTLPGTPESWSKWLPCGAGWELLRMPAGSCWADSLPHLNSPLIPSLSLQLYSRHHCLSVECLVKLSRWVSCAGCPDMTGLTMTGIEDVGGESGEASKAGIVC